MHQAAPPYQPAVVSCEHKAMHVCYVCSLERLQRVVSKVQMESGVCEEQLNQVETLLQTVRHANIHYNKTKCMFTFWYNLQKI